VTVCWNPPQVGNVAKYQLNIGSVDVRGRRRRQLWINNTDNQRLDNDVGGREHCQRLDQASLPPSETHFILLRPWTTDHRPGMSVVALFSLSGL